jgi:hypothetical protein
MAAADEIAVKLGLNATEFKAALKSAGVEIENFKKKADPSALGSAFDGLAKKLGNLKSLGGALAVALGINFQAIAEKIARLWTGLSEGEEERLKNLVDSTGKAADEAEKRLEKAKAAAEKKDQERVERALKQDQLVWDARMKFFEEEKKAIQERIEWMKKASDVERDETKKAADELAKLKFDALPAEEKIAKLKAEQARLQNQLGIDKERGIDTTLIEIELQKNLNQQVDITGKKYIPLTAKMKEAQAFVEAMDEAQGKMNLLLEDTIILMGKAYGKSRDPRDLQNASEETLKDFIKKTEREIATIQGGTGRGATALADAATGFLPQGIVIERLRTDIQRAQFQLNQRRELSEAVSRFGESGARARFTGDPLEFDRLVSSLTTQQDRSTTLLQSLDDRLQTAGFGRR